MNNLEIIKDNKENFLKECYQFCEAINWSHSKLSPNFLSVSKQKMKNYGILYMKEYLSMNEEDIKKYFELKKLAIPVSNYILEELGYGKNIFYLYRDELEKKALSEYCFLIATTTNSTSTINNIAKKLQVSNMKITELASSYATSFKNMSYEDFKQKQENATYQKRIIYIQQKEKNHLIYKILDQILLIDDPIVNIKLIALTNYNINYIHRQAYSYTLKQQENKEEKLVILRKKIQQCRNIIKEEKKKEQQEIDYKKAITTISEFVNSSYKTKEEFCEKTFITKTIFDKCMSILKNNNDPLLQICEKKLKNNQDQAFIILKKQIEQVSYYLENGIKEENQIRPFNILDYYLHINIDFKDFERIAKLFCTEKHLSLIKQFISKNRKMTNVSIEYLLNQHKEVKCAIDERGCAIPGTGKVITKEEKIKIINFLQQKKVPLTIKTYSIAIERFFTNQDLNSYSLKNTK